MFARLFAIAALAALAVAGPLVVRDGQCNTGPIQCCNSVMPASQANSAFGQLGLVDVFADITGLVGISCSPIIGNGGNCQQQPVCCSDNRVSGLVSVNCSPINIVG